MFFFSRSGYRPFINPPPSLGNLLLDITLCSISFWCRFVFLLILGFGLGSVIGLGLGIGLGFGISNLKIFDRWRWRHSGHPRPLNACVRTDVQRRNDNDVVKCQVMSNNLVMLKCKMRQA